MDSISERKLVVFKMAAYRFWEFSEYLSYLFNNVELPLDGAWNCCLLSYDFNHFSYCTLTRIALISDCTIAIWEGLKNRSTEQICCLTGSLWYFTINFNHSGSFINYSCLLPHFLYSHHSDSHHQNVKDTMTLWYLFYGSSSNGDSASQSDRDWPAEVTCLGVSWVLKNHNYILTVGYPLKHFACCALVFWIIGCSACWSMNRPIKLT